MEIQEHLEEQVKRYHILPFEDENGNPIFRAVIDVTQYKGSPPTINWPSIGGLELAQFNLFLMAMMKAGEIAHKLIKDEPI